MFIVAYSLKTQTLTVQKVVGAIHIQGGSHPS